VDLVLVLCSVVFCSY